MTALGNVCPRCNRRCIALRRDLNSGELLCNHCSVGRRVSSLCQCKFCTGDVAEMIEREMGSITTD
jgi:hypothetical protein